MSARLGKAPVSKRHLGLKPNPRDGKPDNNGESQNFDFLPIGGGNRGGPPKGFEIVAKQR